MGVTTALLTLEEYAQLPEEETMRTEPVGGESDAKFVERVKSNCIEILADYIRQNPVSRSISEDAPGLAFEAVSSDSAVFLVRKINAYLATGFRAVWIAYPRERTLMTMHPDQKGRHFREGQYVKEPDLLPGFRVLVDRFFDGI
jgi:Uma2 family endonuclease